MTRMAVRIFNVRMTKIGVLGYALEGEVILSPGHLRRFQNGSTPGCIVGAYTVAGCLGIRPGLTTGTVPLIPGCILN